MPAYICELMMSAAPINYKGNNNYHVADMESNKGQSVYTWAIGGGMNKKFCCIVPFPSIFNFIEPYTFFFNLNFILFLAVFM